MKKIFSLFATAVLLVGITACSNDEGIMTVDDAVSASQKSNTELITIATLSLDDKKSDSIYAQTSTSYSFKGGPTNSVISDPEKTDLLKSLVIKSSDETVCKAEYVKATYKEDNSIKTNAAVKVTGVKEGSAIITVSLGDKVLTSLTEKVEKAEGLVFANLGNASAGDDTLKATEIALDGTVYLSATDLAYEKGAKFGTVDEANTKVNSSVIGGNSGYKVTGQKDNEAISVGDVIGTFSTTITAKEACKISKIIYTVGSTSFNITGKVAVQKAGSEKADYETKTTLTPAKGYGGTDSPNVSLDKDGTAKITISIYAEATKNAGAGINFGIGNLIIVPAK